jgi:hypothetical protein
MDLSRILLVYGSACLEVSPKPKICAYNQSLEGARFAL